MEEAGYGLFWSCLNKFMNAESLFAKNRLLCIKIVCLKDDFDIIIYI